jgi:uncharacterized protein
MRISDPRIAFAVSACVAIGGTYAHAFEAKQAPTELVPGAALPALPDVTKPALPNFGTDRTVKDAWRNFSRSYRAGDKQKALSELEFAAEKGDLTAQWQLARMYATGDGVGRDSFRAFQMFSKIADVRPDERDNPANAGMVAHAFVALGAYWMEGIPQSHVKADPTRAMRLFDYAATYYGHPEAQYQLARMLLDGSAGRRDPRVALRWLNNAAEKHHVQAQAVLGRMLFLGEHTPRQVARGLMWLRVARETADTQRDAWIFETYQKAFDASSENDRQFAEIHAERFLKSPANR